MASTPTSLKLKCTHIVINLAPADIKKEGSGFDLPMALGILGAYGGLNKKEISDCLFVGELSLDGGIRGIRGALPIAIEARGRKISRMVVPELNAREAAMVTGVTVYPVKSLLDVIHFVNTGNGDTLGCSSLDVRSLYGHLINSISRSGLHLD
jgi:magnesium chelatase family protein